MSVNFVASGPIEWGSARMRAWWVAAQMPGAVASLQPVEGADVYIWQKRADVEFIKANPQARHWWDVCDPIHWFDPDYAVGVLALVEGVVCSNEGLAEDMRRFTSLPVYVIPDRLLMSHFERRVQKPPCQESGHTRFVWFGVSVNRVAIFGGLANLERLAVNGHSVSLTIFDDRPDVVLRATDSFPVYHVQWQLSKEVEVLSSHDVAFLPPYPGPWGRVKSDNKKITAAACGLPVWDGQDYRAVVGLDILAWHSADNPEQLARYNVCHSAREWEALLWPS